MNKTEKIFHNGTYIGSIITRKAIKGVFVYGFPANARPGDLPHYIGTNKEDCIDWLKYMRNRETYPVAYDYIFPQPRFKA